MLGRLREQLFLALGVGNYQSNEFIQRNESDNFAQLLGRQCFRRHQQLPQHLQAKTCTLTPDGACASSPVPICRADLLTPISFCRSAYFAEAPIERSCRVSGGPHPHPGELQQNPIHFTQNHAHRGIAVADGLSPFARSGRLPGTGAA